MAFALHPQLADDCYPLGALALSQLLLMNDAAYPWLIVVPRREDVREIFDLNMADQLTLMREVSTVAKAMKTCFEADKINIAALGNIVPQLHIHVIARRRRDPAWPGPVWAKQPPTPYAESEREQIMRRLRQTGIDGLAWAHGPA